MLWGAGFWNCNHIPAAHDPSQRKRGGRAAMGRTESLHRAVTHDDALVPAERRIRHHWHAVLLAPRQNVTLNVTITETVRDLIGCASMSVRNAEQILHLGNGEVGNSPGANLSRGPQM